MELFGFGLVGAPAGTSHREIIASHLDMVEEADRLGVDGWYFVEHHGHAEFSVCAAPNMFAAAAAVRTTRLRLGNMVTVLPFSHPVRVAEEIRLLDVLS